MAKQLTSNRYIYKIDSTRLREADWDLKIEMEDAKKNEEVIGLGDSQLLRFIRKLCGRAENEEETIKSLKRQIKEIKKEKTNVKSKSDISKKYKELDEILFIPEYIAVHFDKMADFDRACNKQGFTVNGVKFKRLLGTTGGIKNNVVMFCSEVIHGDLTKLLHNDYNKETKIIPAKFEAYKALASSVSSAVSMPRILVIKDGCVTIKDKVIKVSGDETFQVEHNVDYEAEKEFCDGCGMISKEMADRWAEDLELHYTPCAFNTRFAFNKGMVGVFDFKRFGLEVAGTNKVIDCWGNEQDVNEIDVVLTTNMLKLWAAYDSIEDYMAKCNKNGWEFCVAKYTPKKLENKRNMNYQYLQSYEDMSDEDIDLLINETITDINGALGDDYIKQILFLKGINISEKTIKKENYDYLRAMLIDKEVCNDSYVKSRVLGMISKKINDAKKGVLKVNGNYSIVLGDLYGLSQSMFGLEITGLLKRDEFYAKTWIDKGVNKVVAYRSPMTSHNNIKIMDLVDNDEVNKWFGGLGQVIILNAWDTTTDALNGCDFDSDALITTDNEVLLRNTRKELPIICEQKSAQKVVVTEKLLRKSNKDGFGNDVGTITNRVTTMFDVLASFQEGSVEHDQLMYRIICGQAYQQESIDKIKGIKAKEMPKEWYSYKDVKKYEEENKELFDLYVKTMVNKKPYFFIYNYSHLLSKYNTFIKNVNNNCIYTFGLTLEELRAKEDKNEREEEFVKNIDYKSPVFTNASIMNRICWRIEKEFKDVRLKVKPNGFDYSIYKTNKKYSKTVFEKIKVVYKEYRRSVGQCIKDAKDGYSKEQRKQELIEEYKVKTEKICPNAEDLCNIAVDICYKGNMKNFAWEITGEQMIKNLLARNENTYKFPALDDEGDIEWNGHRFIMKEVEICEE